MGAHVRTVYAYRQSTCTYIIIAHAEMHRCTYINIIDQLLCMYVHDGMKAVT